MRVEVLKVSSKSNPNSVAGALAGVLRERGNAEIQAIGAGALNQAIKAIAIARGFVAPSGMDLVCVPAFTDIDIDGDQKTAIKLISPRKHIFSKPYQLCHGFFHCIIAFPCFIWKDICIIHI